MSNRSEGNHFETEFCNLLYEHGFWVHNMAQNQAGQPADVIACKNGRAYLIDCKVCADDKFLVSRAEENQISAMKLFESRGNNQGLFALKFEKADEIYMVSLDDVLKFTPRMHRASMRKDDMRLYANTITHWLKLVDLCTEF